MIKTLPWHIHLNLTFLQMLLIVTSILGIGILSLFFLTILTLVYCFCDQLTACGRSFHTLAGIWQATACEFHHYLDYPTYVIEYGVFGKSGKGLKFQPIRGEKALFLASDWLKFETLTQQELRPLSLCQATA